ncbi:MAG: hypothetical protein HKP53_05155 [Eudoraea sp.]|nr:hypothetical protein [Eudoraea sp.]
MRQDLRDLFKEEREKKHRLKAGHETRFEDRLTRAFPKRKRSPLRIWGIAASVIVLLGLGGVFFQQTSDTDPDKTVELSGEGVQEQAQGISLGDVSPDLKKVETYYVTSINMELADLELSSENKVVVDDFMSRIGELNKEYMALNQELNEVGPNEQTIAALIRNLQLRLQLLLKLKEKLHQLKSSENETVTTNNA